MFKFNHVALKVNDLEGTMDFYERLFGFKYDTEIEYPTFKVVFLKNLYDKNLKLELVVFNAKSNNTNDGAWNHICLETDDFDGLIGSINSSIYKQDLHTTVNDSGSRSVFINGLNNERIQILEKSS